MQDFGQSIQEKIEQQRSKIIEQFDTTEEQISEALKSYESGLTQQIKNAGKSSIDAIKEHETELQSVSKEQMQRFKKEMLHQMKDATRAKTRAIIAAVFLTGLSMGAAGAYGILAPKYIKTKSEIKNDATKDAMKKIKEEYWTLPLNDWRQDQLRDGTPILIKRR